MKKVFVLLLVVAIFYTACQENTDNVKPSQDIDMSDFFVYTDDASDLKSASHDHSRCESMKVLNRQLRENPGLERKMYNIELHTRKAINAKKPTNPGGGNGGGGGGGEDPTSYTGSVTIPVVINILEDPAHPVTNAHIQSQIAILNDDYNNGNSNTSGIPNEFDGVLADCNINFVLDHVVRKASTKSSWGTNDAMKLSSQGGIDAADASVYLNVWVCEIGGGILGYAQFPGGSASTDGVVIGSDYFGENGAGGVYGHGRTATHEVGHWLNLRHIWGDGRCRQDDFVTDTPGSDRANYGCPTYPTVHCKSNDMTMNYMDYTYDDCMNMFTNGQNDRMRALLVSGGDKASFVGN